MFEDDREVFSRAAGNCSSVQKVMLGGGVGLAVAIVVFFSVGEMFVGGFVGVWRLVEKDDGAKRAFRELETKSFVRRRRAGRSRNEFPRARGGGLAGGGSIGPLGEGKHGGADNWSDGALSARVEFADGFDGVAEKFDADGALGLRGEELDDAAADGELAGELDHFGAGVADGGEMGEQIVERDFGVFGEGAGEGKIEVGILIAPEGGDDRGDDQGDLAVGEAKKRGGAALENVGVGALRLPGKRVEGGECGDAAVWRRGRCWRRSGEFPRGLRRGDWIR